jgi:hypothetical protein
VRFTFWGSTKTRELPRPRGWRSRIPQHFKKVPPAPGLTQPWIIVYKKYNLKQKIAAIWQHCDLATLAVMVAQTRGGSKREQ